MSRKSSARIATAVEAPAVETILRCNAGRAMGLEQETAAGNKTAVYVVS